jgi:hypothetical protein
MLANLLAKYIAISKEESYKFAQNFQKVSQCHNFFLEV